MKKSSKLPLIISIIAVIVVGAFIAGIVFVTTTFFHASNERSTEYGAAVQMIESSQKAFTAGEVARVGPYDVTTTSVRQDYMPSQAESDTIQKAFDRAQALTKSSQSADHYGYSLTQETGQYVAVTLNLTYNQGRAEYDTLKASQYNWMIEFSKTSLNSMVPLVVSPDANSRQTSRSLMSDAKSQEGTTLTLIYRVPKTETAFTLKYSITIFTKVSSLVGTEGMPRKEYEYTIGIE